MVAGCFIHIYLYIYEYICVICMYIYMYIYVYILIYIYMYMYIYIRGGLNTVGAMVAGCFIIFMLATAGQRSVWHESFMYVWHDSLICVTWLIHMCHMTHTYVWHDSFICVTWLIHICDMTHSLVLYDSFIRVSHVAFTYGVAMISRLLKIIGVFCKKAYIRDDILQKRPEILRSLLIVATP